MNDMTNRWPAPVSVRCEIIEAICDYSKAHPDHPFPADAFSVIEAAINRSVAKHQQKGRSA